jgi:hypothetical protein
MTISAFYGISRLNRAVSTTICSELIRPQRYYSVPALKRLKTRFAPKKALSAFSVLSISDSIYTFAAEL